MATTPNSGTITYDSASNTITLTGGWHTTTLTAIDAANLKYKDGDFNALSMIDDTRLRQLWFSDYDIDVPDADLMVRTMVSWVYQEAVCNSLMPSEPAIGDEMVVSWRARDILAAADTNGWVRSSDGLPVVESVGAGLYFFRCNILLDCSSSRGMLSFYNEGIEFDLDEKLGLKLDGKGIIQTGELFNGSAKSGVQWSQNTSGTNSSGAFNGGLFRFLGSNFALGTGFGFQSNSLIHTLSSNFNGYKNNKGVSFYITGVGSDFVDTTFSHTPADKYRNFSITLRAPATFDRATFSDNAKLAIQHVYSTDIIIRDMVIGEGDFALSAVNFNAGAEPHIKLINPTNFSLSDISWGTAQTTYNFVDQIALHTGSVIDLTGDPIEGSLINVSDKDNNESGHSITIADGTSDSIEVLVAQDSNHVSEPTQLVEFNPHTVRYFKYGYAPVELSKDYVAGSVVEQMLLRVDPVITRDETYASGVYGVTLGFGAFFDEGGNEYACIVDCGQNNLNDVYHNLAYRFATYDENDTDATKGRNFASAVLSSTNGTNFQGQRGFLITNYTGVLDYTEANDGTRYTPPRYSLLTFSGVERNSEVRIYEQTNGTELGGTENVLSDSWTYSYLYSGTSQLATAVIFHPNYDPVSFEVNIDGSDTSIPVTQRFDRVYTNPPSPDMVVKNFVAGKNGSKTFNLLDLIEDATYEGETVDSAELLSIAITQNAANGTIVDNGDDTFTYTPNTDYLGADFFYFQPTFASTYTGAVLPVRCEFAVLPYAGQRYDHVIMLGDSITTFTLSPQTNAPGPEGFAKKLREQFGRDINFYNESYSGYATDMILNDLPEILARYSHLNPSRTLVTISTGTNDWAGIVANDTSDQAQTIIDTQYRRDRMRERIPQMKAQVEAYGFDFWLCEPTFIPWDKDVIGQQVFDRQTQTFIDEWVGNLLVMEHDNGIWDIQDDLSPQYVYDPAEVGDHPVGTSNSIDNLYYYTRLMRENGFADNLHPSKTAGRRQFQDAFIDGIYLYSEYGVKPNQLTDTLTGRISVSITGGTVASAAGVTDSIGRVTNEVVYDTATGVTDHALYYGASNTLAPVTLSISAGHDIMVSNLDEARSDAGVYLPVEYLRDGIDTPAGGATIYLTFKGLQAGAIYRFNSIGTPDYGHSRWSIITDPVLNRTAEQVQNAGQHFGGTGEGTGWNTYDYQAMLLIPQTSEITLEINGYDVDNGATLSALELWKLCDAPV